MPNIIAQSSVNNLVYGYNNVRRAQKNGYADSRVGSLTTVASLITDIETFRDSVAVNPALKPIFDALTDSIRWAAAQDTALLDTTIVTALTTVDDTTVSATTDLGYVFRGHTNFPTDAGVSGQSDLTVFQPNS